jgi:hypothetical protein
LLKASGSTVIDVTLPETQQGVAVLVAAGVLTSDDQAILWRQSGISNAAV